MARSISQIISDLEDRISERDKAEASASRAITNDVRAIAFLNRSEARTLAERKVIRDFQKLCLYYSVKLE